MQLTGATQGTIATASATGVIRTNDVQLTFSNADVNEGDEVNVVLYATWLKEVRLNGLDVKIKRQTKDSTATSPQDYTSISVGTFGVIRSGQTIATLSTNDVGQPIGELDEVFSFEIETGVGNTAEVQLDTMGITIKKNL